MYLIWQGGGIKMNKCCVSVVRDATQVFGSDSFFF